jgi:hypothetical protein
MATFCPKKKPFATRKTTGYVPDIGKGEMIMTESAYLRRELIEARGLLAECMGWINAIERLEPNAAAVTRQHIQDRVREFQTHGVAVLPAGVVP